MKIETADYFDPLEEYLWADLMSVEDFISSCEDGGFIDYDGYGYPVKEGFVASGTTIFPSDRDEIPADATQIIWFNR